MKQRHLRPDEIRVILQELRTAGKSTREACHENGISPGTLYRWKLRYSGDRMVEPTRLDELAA